LKLVALPGSKPIPISSPTNRNLREEELMLCQAHLEYSLATKKWGFLGVDGSRDVTAHALAFDRLDKANQKVLGSEMGQRVSNIRFISEH
jgi:hypothetical protein